MRRGPLRGGLGRGLAKLKAVSGDSGDEWLVEPDYHHQGRLGTAGHARWAHRAAQECIKYLLALPVRHQTPQLESLWLCLPKVAIVTGGLKGHDPLPQVEGGGQDALSSV